MPAMRPRTCGSKTHFSWSKTIFAVLYAFFASSLTLGRLGEVDEHVLDALGGAVDDQPLGDDRGVLGADLGVLGGLALLGEDLGGRRVAAEDDLALEGAQALGLDRGRGRRRRRRAGRGRCPGGRGGAASWARVPSSRRWNRAPPRRRSNRSPDRRSRRSRRRGWPQAKAEHGRLADPARHHCISPGVWTRALARGTGNEGPETRRPGDPSRHVTWSLSRGRDSLSSPGRRPSRDR